jgi:hypothetical protein
MIADISEEQTACNFKAEVKMEAICSSEKFVTKHGTKYVD